MNVHKLYVMITTPLDVFNIIAITDKGIIVLSFKNLKTKLLSCSVFLNAPPL